MCITNSNKSNQTFTRVIWLVLFALCLLKYNIMCHASGLGKYNRIVASQWDWLAMESQTSRSTNKKAAREMPFSFDSFVSLLLVLMSVTIALPESNPTNLHLTFIYSFFFLNVIIIIIQLLLLCFFHITWINRKLSWLKSLNWNFIETSNYL